MFVNHFCLENFYKHSHSVTSMLHPLLPILDPVLYMSIREQPAKTLKRKTKSVNIRKVVLICIEGSNNYRAGLIVNRFDNMIKSWLYLINLKFSMSHETSTGGYLQ